jgi:monoamine oxidase
MSETRIAQITNSIGGAPPTDVPWAESPTNRLAPDEKSVEPIRLQAHYLLKNDPLVGLEDWLKPEFRDIDLMSLRQFFTKQGASPEALRKSHYYFWEAKNGGYHLVEGGTSALTDAMAASLKRPVLLNQNVSTINLDKSGVSVSCTNGASFKARACVTTIPLSVMRDIRITGTVPAEQRAAWQSQRYLGVVQIFFKLRSPFWEKDGLPATMWTDGPFEIIAHLPSTMDPKGVFMASINGAGVEPLNRLSEAELGAKALAEIIRLRPAAAGEIEVAHIHNWSTYPFSKGHVAYFAPGDIGRFAGIVGQPVGRLHFAGEHLSRVHAGIEGACESAETAVVQILDALDRA